MRRLAPLLALLAAALAGCGGTSTVTTTVTKTAPVAATAAATTPSGGGTFEQIPQVVSHVAPSIVTILSQMPQGQAEGSGVIWSSGGQIVTNNHVVQGASSLEVVFASGERVKATVKARDPLSDLAVVTVDKQNLPAAQFAGGLPPVGSLAIAMGSPLGFENTVTEGIISGLHRSLPANGQEAQALVDLIQTDAPISPGNSGGALVDAAGKVIGINVAYIPPQARAVSIGFAIPAATVKDVVAQLISKGKATHAFLGIQPQDVTRQMAQRFGLKVSAGVVVYQVVSGSAAAKAGLKPGDVIVSMDGRKIQSVDDLLAQLRKHHQGDTVTLTVVRNGSKQQVKVTLSGRSAG